jgi:hypothetical protein
MKKNILLFLIVWSAPLAILAQSVSCANATAIDLCQQGPIFNIPNLLNQNGPLGPNYGCFITPNNITGTTNVRNQVYFFLNPSTNDPIQIVSNAIPPNDIDAIIWGPFPSQAAMLAACNQMGTGGVNGGVVACDYTNNSAINLNFTPVAGSFYMLMISNFAAALGGVGITNVSLNITTTNAGANDVSLICPPPPVTISQGEPMPNQTVNCKLGLACNLNFSNNPNLTQLIATNTNTFNPVGLPGSGLTNTNVPGTYIYYAGFPGTNQSVPLVYNILPTPSFSTTIYNQCTGVANLDITTTVGLPPFLFSLNGSPNTTNSTFVNQTNGVYTITVSHNNGCTKTQTAVVNLPPLPILNAITVTKDCGTNKAAVTINGTSFSGALEYNISPNGWFGNINSFANLNSGSYTITVKDNDGCTSSSSILIHPTIAPFNLTSTSNCYDVANPPILTAVNLNVPIVNFNFIFNGLSAQSSPSPVFTTTSNPGLYTVIATDIYGCTRSATTILGTSTTFTLTQNNNCVGGSSGQNLGLVINPITGVGPFNYTLNSQPPTNSNPIPILIGGIYTVTATSSQGCSATSTVIVPNCCNIWQPIGEAPPANAVYYTNDINGEINLNNIFGTTLPQTPVVFDGNVVVNFNFNMLFNNDIYLAENTSIKLVNPNSNLVIDRSTLRGCGSMWQGIYANQANQTVSINASTLKRMSQIPNIGDGIVMQNHAKLLLTNSEIVGSLVGVSFSNYWLNWPCIVENNTFKSDPNWFPGNCLKGITMAKVNNAIIGNPTNPNMGNKFKNLVYGGIEIFGEPYSSNLLPFVWNVKLYNNRFENILEDPKNDPYFEKHVLQNTFFNGPSQQVSFITLGASAILSSGGKDVINLLVQNAVSTEEPFSFINCNKGIITSNTNLTAQNLKMKNTFIGIAANAYKRRRYNINKVSIEGCFLGMQFTNGIGNLSVINNIIQSREEGVFWEYETVTNNSIYLPPKGIIASASSFNSLFTNAIQNISNNGILLHSPSGAGLNVSNFGSTATLSNNQIEFQTNYTGLLTNSYNYFKERTLTGISMVNCNNSTISENRVLGQNVNSVFQARNSRGLILHNTKNLNINCNLNAHVWFGMYALGNNTTNALKLKQNKFAKVYHGLYTFDFGNLGTFGHIGNLSTDNSNNFEYYGPGYNTFLNGYRVFRNSTQPNNRNIYNDVSNSKLVANLESGALNYPARYGVFNTSNQYQNNCLINNANLVNLANGGSNDDEIVAEFADDVIDNTVPYIANNAVARWIDMKQLYDNLDAYQDLRDNNTDYEDFYDDHFAEEIGVLRRIDMAIDTLINDTLNIDTIKLNFVKTLNNNFVPTTLMGTNEKAMNQLYLKQLELGINSLDNVDKDALNNMANSCLYVNGTAVFKARTLALQLNPSMDFYEVSLCTAQGKNGGISDDEYISQKTTSSNLECIILENPLDQILKLKHSKAQNITFIIYDMIGNAIKRVELDSQSNFANINVTELPMGNYIYKCIFDNKSTLNGKILIK